MKERVRHSIGQNYVNDGQITEIKEEKFVLERSRKFYALDVIPMSGIRMSSSDRWKTDPNHADPNKRQRRIVQQYFAYKDAVVSQSLKVGYELKETLDIVFFIPMPNGWSKKKKKEMVGMPHKQTLDVDNLIKGFMDSLKENDGDVWRVNASKIWAYKGSILIYQ